MAVHDYIKNCQYNLNELDNYIYLYEFDEPILNYITDRDETNGKGVNINGTSTRLYCESVQYSSTSSINNRFAFENTLTVTLLETKEVTNYKIIQQLLNGNWMVVFKNVDGDAFVVNAEFPVMVSYQYVFNDEKSPNKLTITFKAIQNTPTINLSNAVVFSTTIRDKGCEYNISRINSLKMVSMNKANVDVEGDGFYIEEIGKGSLKTIEFNDTTMSFTDSYDGKEFKQTLSFQIPFNSYRFYFHYNLLEYLENRYYALIETSNGNNILGGFREGLFPSYSISTSDNNNTITIELNAIYTTYSVLGSDTMRITTNDEYNYKPITGDCVNGIYTYTLIEQINSDGTTTNSYYCLEGFEDNYSTYNIIGTYKQFDTSFGFKLVDYNFDCGGNCRIEDLPVSIKLTKNESVCYAVDTECEVTFESDNSNIIIDYDKEQKRVCITSLVNQGTYQIKAKFEDGTSQYSTVVIGGGTVTGDTSDTIYITAEAQTISVIPSKGYGNVKSISTNLQYVTNQNNNGYNVTVKENTDDLNKRAYTIVLGYMDGTTETINVIQDVIYYKVVKTENTECFGEDLYYMNKKYKGYTSTKIDIFVGNEKGNLKEKQSTNCMLYETKTVVAKVCVEGKTYEFVEYKKNDVVIKKELVYKTDNCDSTDKTAESTEYVINTGITECVDNRPYYVEEQYAKVDGELIKLYPTITRVSTTENIGSNVCDVLDPSNPDGTILYRWVDTDETYCLNVNAKTNCTSSSTSTYCDGYNLYQNTTNYIDPLCDGNWVISGDTITTLVEENSSECGYYCPDVLSFEFSGDTSGYIINGVKYTATTSPYTVTLSELGITEFTSANGMCDNWGTAGNKTSITAIPCTDNVTDMSYMFHNCTSLISLDLSSLNTSNVTDISGMFYNCRGLTSLDVSSFNTSNVTNMYNMFSNCRGLTSLDVSNFNTSNVTNISQMFSNCSGLTSLDLSSFNTSNVTNMRYMFSYCSSLTSLDLSSFNTSNVTDISGMFIDCGGLTSLDVSNFNTSNVTDISQMFSNCSGLTSLDLSSFNTSNVTNISQMFYGCNGLTSLDLSSFNTSNVTSMSYMFYGCNGLTSLDLSGWNTSNVTNMNNMFYGCNGLTSLDLSGWNTSNVTNMGYMFRGCRGLTSITMNNCSCETIQFIKDRLSDDSILNNVTIITNSNCQ